MLLYEKKNIFLLFSWIRKSYSVTNWIQIVFHIYSPEYNMSQKHAHNYKQTLTSTTSYCTSVLQSKIVFSLNNMSFIFLWISSSCFFFPFHKKPHCQWFLLWLMEKLHSFFIPFFSAKNIWCDIRFACNSVKNTIGNMLDKWFQTAMGSILMNCN